jgi:hypothetical protein
LITLNTLIKTLFVLFPMALQPFGLWQLFQILNPIHSW